MGNMENLIKIKARQLLSLCPSAREFNDNQTFVNTLLHETLYVKGWRDVDVTTRTITARWRGLFFNVPKSKKVETLVRNDVWIDVDLPIYNFFKL